MNLKELMREDDAVSPVIGVILMVAITVILAAVIASFVLGMGPNTAQTPTASFSSEYDSTNNYLVITMESGTTRDATKLSFSADDWSGGGGSDTNVYEDGNSDWAGAHDTATEVTAGTSIKINVDDTYSVDLIYTDGDTSSTMQSFES